MLNKVKDKIRRLVKEGADVFYEEGSDLYYDVSVDDYSRTHKYTIDEIKVEVDYYYSNGTPKSARIRVAYVDFGEYLLKEEILKIKDLLMKIYKEQEGERGDFVIRSAINYLEEE